MMRLSAGIDATRPDLLVERLEPSGVGRGVGLVGVAAGSVGGAEGVGDVLHIDLGVGHRLEGVRVDIAMVMVRLFDRSRLFTVMVLAFPIFMVSTPLVSSTIAALVALASTRRCRKPSNCRPLTSTTSAPAMATASVGFGS